MKATMTLMAAAVLSFAGQAFAKDHGMIVGGGGKAVLLTNADGTTKLEVLDLWEATELYNRTQIKLTGDLAADVDAALVRLQNSYPVNGACNFGTGTVYVNQDCALESMRLTAARFLASGGDVQWKHGLTLLPTPDSMEWALPENCPNESCLVQIVDYQADDNIVVDADSYAKLDELNQAALIVHESIYRFLRTWAGETNSVRSRRAVGYSFAGGSFPTPQLPGTSPTGSFVLCLTQNMAGLTADRIFVTTDGSGNTTFAQDLFAGSSPMGISSISEQLKDPLSMFADFASGKCSSDYGWETRNYGQGPVEGDRIVQWDIQCRTGQAPLLVGTELAPGETQATTVQYSCHASP